MFRFLTAGESHGQALVTIIEGMPSGVPLEAEHINRDLARRQGGYGRGGRMKIEKDQVEILSGVRYGRTLGSPITLLIRNRDWENWQRQMAIEPVEEPSEPIVIPRPGHADLAGALKYGFTDIRNSIERASARETAARVAAGAVAKRLLEECGIHLVSHVLQIGTVVARDIPQEINLLRERAEASVMRCADPEATEKMCALVDEARKKGDTLGGIFEIIAEGVPPGLGSYAQFDRRLSARLAMAIMSIPAIKGVEIGLGFEAASRFGSQVHDEIYYSPKERRFRHRTNNAGGLTGGITNGEPIVVRAAMKPISTLLNPLQSVRIDTKEPVESRFERSDICAVPAAAVVGEAMMAITLVTALQEKFGGDHLEELQRNIRAFWEELAQR